MGKKGVKKGSSRSVSVRGKSLISQLTEKERRRAVALAKRTKFRNTSAVLSYGAEVQRDLTEQSRALLGSVRAKDLEPVSKSLQDLLSHIRKLNVVELPKKAGSRRFFGIARRFLARYERVEDQINEIVLRLRSSQDRLLKDVALLDRLYVETESSYRRLMVHLVAGQMKLTELRVRREELGKVAKDSGDPMDAQKARDLGGLITRLERQLHNLRLTANYISQTGPTIRTIQGGDSALVEKIQMSITTAVPVWQHSLALTAALIRQRGILELQRQVTATTNDLIRRRAIMLRDNITGIAQELEAGVFNVATLVASSQMLEETISEVLRIRSEGRRRRVEEIKQLETSERKLRQKLLAAKAGS